MVLAYILVGGFLGVFFAGFLGVFVFFIMIAANAPYNRDIRITTWTAGKPLVELYKGRKITHPQLGDVYYIPKLKNEGRQYIPYFGTKYEFPTNKSKRIYVPVTFYNGEYVPESYDPYTKEVREVITRDTIVDPKTKKEKVTFAKTNKEVTTFILRPTKQSMRLFNLRKDTEIKEEYKEQAGWWARNGTTVVSIVMLLIVAVFCFFMIFFTIEAFKETMIGVAPPWIQTLVDTIQTGQAPPTGGQ